jgi:hypothetical protein
MLYDTSRRLRRWYHFYACSRHFFSTFLLSTLLGCDFLPHPGDTDGIQHMARWMRSGRVVVDTDPHYTIVRLRLDTVPNHAGHDVLLTRFDFDPTQGTADGYALTVALDLGRARDLPGNHRLPLGPPPARIPAYGTVTCLCRPMRPDSVRGTYEVYTRGIAQLSGRIDATLYFTAWDDSTRHDSYRLKQQIEGVRWP